MVIIGGGIAGLSSAYFVSSMMADGGIESVTVIEAETSLAYHTTGRSAALLIYNYGNDAIRPLNLASGPFLSDPPAGFSDHPLLADRGIVTVADAANHALFETQLAAGQALVESIPGLEIVELESSEAVALAPHVRFDDDIRAMYEPGAKSIDVAGLHQGFVRGFRANGGTIATARRADAVVPDGSGDGHGWTIETTDGELHADIVVNAAGAWGDHVARRAGVAPVGLTPMRRTAFMVESRFDDSERFPFVANAPHDWYAGPDGRQFLCSPADETPTEAADAKPEEIDIARAIDLINEATHLDIRSVKSSWAGQRTFAPDRSMVIGPDPEHSSFMWCVGQGGTGIQTSPAAGQLVAEYIAAQAGVDGSTSTSNPVDVSAVDRPALAASRFRH